MSEFERGYVLFSGKDCSACKTLKDTLNNKNIEYKEFDIWNNPDALKYMMGKGYRSIPQLFLDGVKIDV
jgi:glutaredoxin 3